MHYLANGLVADAGVLVVRPVSQWAEAALLAVTSFFLSSSPDHWFSSHFDKEHTVWEYLTHSLCGLQLHTASKPYCTNTDHFDKMKNKTHWPQLYIQEWKKGILFQYNVAVHTAFVGAVLSHFRCSIDALSLLPVKFQPGGFRMALSVVHPSQKSQKAR